MTIHKDILAYNKSQDQTDRDICDLLAKVIDEQLAPKKIAPAEVENKIWHAHPVWLIEGNPIVGYSKLKTPKPNGCIRLLFWNGQSFDEPGLAPEGTFKAADARYTECDDINLKDLKRWLAKSIEIQWDYKNLIKRKGKLERLK